MIKKRKYVLGKIKKVIWFKKYILQIFRLGVVANSSCGMYNLSKLRSWMGPIPKTKMIYLQ